MKNREIQIKEVENGFVISFWEEDEGSDTEQSFPLKEKELIATEDDTDTVVELLKSWLEDDVEF